MQNFRVVLCVVFAIRIANVQAQTNTLPDSGNVGIGTTVPQKNLEVQTAANNYVSIGSQMVSGEFSGLHFGYLENGHHLYRKSALVFERLDQAARGRIHILNNGTLDGASARLSDSRLTINYDGKVGIGTVSPAKLLDVRGSARFSTEEDAINEIQIGSSSNGFNGGRVAFLGAGGGPIASIQGTYTENPNRGVISFQQLNIGDTWNEVMRIDGENVGIGTSAPADRLSVNGRVSAEEVKVVANNWPDYVFDAAYKLPSLKETERFIKVHGHLPEIPSSREVSRNGIEIGEMNAKLLEKIEQLTLYLIELEKNDAEQEKRLKELEEANMKLKMSVRKIRNAKF